MREDISGVVFKFIVVPVIYLMGIIVVGGIIQDAFHLPGAVTGLFDAAGGIGGLALYFRANLNR